MMSEAVVMATWETALTSMHEGGFRAIFLKLSVKLIN
jgi:hypothetical protein